MKNRGSLVISKLKVDCGIFSGERTPFEALVCFLKDHKEMSYHDIAEVLDRDERNIWTVYDRGKRKR